MKRKITKKIKKIGKILLWILISFIAVDILVVSAFFVKPIQNFVVNKVMTTLSEKWESEISIEHVYLTPTLKVKIYGFVIKDYHANDMIRVDYAKGRLKGIKVAPFNLFLGSVEGKGGEVVIRRYAGEEKVNIALWAEKFKKGKSKFLLIIDRINVKEMNFRYVNDEQRLYSDNNDIDYAFFELQNISFDCLKFTVNRADISGKVTHLSFQQYTGFQLLNATGDFRINEKQLVFNNALVVTPSSHLFLDLAFSYAHWESYASFLDSVKIIANVRPSTLNTEDIAFFVPSLKGMKNSLILKGNVHGNVNDISLRNMHLNVAKNTFVEGDFCLKNVTDFQHLVMNIDLQRSNVDFAEISAISLPKQKQITLPKTLQQLSDVQLMGTFAGKLTQFETHLTLTSSCCAANIDLATSESQEQIIYKGDIALSHLNLTQLVTEQEVLRSVSGSTQIQGTASHPFNTNDNFIESLHAEITGTINQLQIKEYNYQNIDFNGTYLHKNYEAHLNSKDPNLQFLLDGAANFTGKTPSYNAALTTSHFALGEVGKHFKNIDSTHAKGFDKLIYFVQKHSDANLSLRSLKINLTGSSIDELSGAIMVDSLLYLQDSNLLPINSLRFVALNNEGVRKYRLISDIVNASLTTTYPIKTLLDTLSAVAAHYVPNLLPNRENVNNHASFVASSPHTDCFLIAQLETFNTRRFLSFFQQDFTIAPNSKLSLRLDSKHDKDSIYFSSRAIRINKNVRLYNVAIKGYGEINDVFALQCAIDSFNFPVNANQFSFKKIDFLADIQHNKVNYQLHWQNPKTISNESSSLLGNVEFTNLSHFLFHFSPTSEIAIKDYKWRFNEQNALQIKNSALFFDEVKLSTEKSSIQLNGILSNKGNSPLKIDVTNLNLAILNSLFNQDNLTFGGDISAELNFIIDNGKKVLNGKALVTDFMFNQTEFGNIFVLASLPTQNNVRFVGGIYESDKEMNSAEIHNYSYTSFEKEKSKVALLNGGYDIKKKEFAIYTNVSSLNVDFLQPFLSSFSHYVKGNASAELAFIARPDTFYFDGKVMLKRAEIGIAPLNTIYTAENQQIDFNTKGIEFNRVILKDKYDNPAVLHGHVYHNKFKNMTLDLTIESERILVLNTDKSLDMPFYGDGFIKGKVSIAGNEKQLKFSGNNISTRKGTNFFLPLYFSDVTSESNVIVFKSPLHEEKQEEKGKTEGGMEMIFDFSVDITPDAVVQIELDPSIGGTLQARVEGPLRFEYSTASDMSLTGTLVLQTGFFHLTLKDIIDKMLTLSPGGTINFVGPLDLATVQLSGVYKTKASLNDIIPIDEAEGTNLRRTPVNAYIHLVGNLFNPSIDFSFELPNSTNDIATLFYSALDTTVAENRTRQFFSLLVLGKFESSQNASDMVASAVEYSGVELLTNTINNFISQNLKYVDIGLKYRNADESHAQEYSLSASTSLFNDRVIIEGSFGYTNDKTNNIENNSNFIGDYSMEYALDESKNWRVKVFNVTNQYSSLTQSSPYAQGVALIFKKEFNNKKDFSDSRKRSSAKTKKEKKIKK